MQGESASALYSLFHTQAGGRQPSVKITEAGGPHGYDPGKKVLERKRHV